MGLLGSRRVDVDWGGVKRWKFTPLLIVNVAEAVYVSSWQVCGSEKVHPGVPSKNLGPPGRHRGTPWKASIGSRCYHSLHSVLKSARLENENLQVCAIQRLGSCRLPTPLLGL